MQSYSMQEAPNTLVPGETYQFAVNRAGHYIGDEETAKYLCGERGISPELATPENTVCSIGFCEREQKWFGWSHRAIYGFAIGSTVKKGDCGYVPVGWDDFLEEAANFWRDEHHMHVTAVRGVDEDGRECAKVAWEYDDKVPNKKLRGMVSGTIMYPPGKWGKGEWTAATLDDARQMAVDFAEGVS